MLFEDDLPIKDDSPIEDISITYLQLYFNESDHKLFKDLCLKGMVKMYPETFGEANISDFILNVLKLYNK